MRMNVIIVLSFTNTYHKSLEYNRQRPRWSHCTVFYSILDCSLELTEISRRYYGLSTYVLHTTEGCHAEAVFFEAILEKGVCSFNATTTAVSPHFFYKVKELKWVKLQKGLSTFGEIHSEIRKFCKFECKLIQNNSLSHVGREGFTCTAIHRQNHGIVCIIFTCASPHLLNIWSGLVHMGMHKQCCQKFRVPNRGKCYSRPR